MKPKIGDTVQFKKSGITGTVEKILRGTCVVKTPTSMLPAWPEDLIVVGLSEVSLEKEMDEHQKLVDEIMNIQGIEPIEAEIEEVYHYPEGYIFKDENGNVINATQIVLEKKHNDKLKLESTKTVREYWSEYARIYIEIYEDEPNECVLTHLYTLESHRQKGYGRQALIEAESIAKELGCHTAYLKVETDSWMHEWYLRMGYKWYKNANKEYTWLAKNLTGMEKKKKEYPKTYEECAEIIAELTGSDCNPKGCMGYMSVQLTALQKLLICRDAYWQTYGEEMGLGKPWSPRWYDGYQKKYCIYNDDGNIQKGSWHFANSILAFPTEEMRDAFYENFKSEIEICKELL